MEFKITTKSPDNCVAIGNQIAVVRNFARSDTSDYGIFQYFHFAKAFYSYPLSSDDIGIFTVTQRDRKLRAVSVTDTTNKCVLMEKNGISVAIPFLHTF